MALAPHAFLMYRYKFVGGVYDGQEQAIPHNVIEITVPAVDHSLRMTVEQAEANMKNHGHGFPKGTQFYHYTSTGKCEDGYLVLQFSGYVENPIRNIPPQSYD